MTHLNQMVEQHIREHESRLKHIDKLVDKAKTHTLPDFPEVHTELDGLIRERDRLAVQVDEMKRRSADDWKTEEIMDAGPMGIWDALAQQLETLVERIVR